VHRYIVAAFFFVATIRFAAAADPGPIDPRFDGRWAAIETVTFHNAMESLAGPAPQIKTTLIIADSGKSLGVLSEFGSGRYLISPKSKDRTIMFDSAFRRAKLTLSADGNTIKEDGNVALYVSGRGNALCQVSATFRRSGKQK
jgi:hypothetical protein